MRLQLLVVAFVSLGLSTTLAQDPVVADAEHTKVVFENNEVRVLRFSLKPGEKQAMHQHPDHVIVLLTDQEGKSTTPDGKVRDVPGKAGDAAFRPAYKHTFENSGKTPAEGIIVELKCKPTTADK